MKLRITGAALTAAALGAAWVSAQERDVEAEGSTAARSHSVAQVQSQSALERLEDSAKVKQSSKRSLGTLRLSGGRTLELSVAETIDGKECLIDHQSGLGASASCLDDGLFKHRMVEFTVAFDGGPAAFDELYVTGVVAPSIHSAELVMTNGDVSSLSLSKHRTFVFESTRDALEQGIRPTGFRLYGRGGKLVQTHTFTPPGS